MARGRTCMIACISPNLTDFTFASIIEAAETEARKNDYILLSSSAPDEDTFSELINQLIDSRRVEGIMVINPYADERHTLLVDNVPTVFVGARPREEAVSSVALDDVGVAKAATNYLINLGHRKIAMVTGPMQEDCSQDRCKGYKKALRENNFDFNPKNVYAGDWSATSGYKTLKHMAEINQLPSAIFAQNDRMAIGILRAARELKLVVPDDLTVIGIDDMPLSSYFDPPLTTMQQDMVTIGREAARLLISAVENPEKVQQHLLVPAKLIVRDSTACFG
jgi:DNA-binding LacI/PurR family transcriptional regulator